MRFRLYFLLIISVALLTFGFNLALGAPPAGVPIGKAFVDNFDNPKALSDPKSRWQVSGTVVAGRGIVTVGNPKDNMENTWIATKAFYTGDFTLEVRARLISEPRLWGGYGIWFRMQSLTGIYRDGGQGYVLGYVYGDRGLTLQRWPGVHPVAPRVRMNLDRNWHNIKIVVRGNRITAYFDGKQVFDAQDSEYKEGHIGIGTCYRGVVEVDYVKVSVP